MDRLNGVFKSLTITASTLLLRSTQKLISMWNVTIEVSCTQFGSRIFESTTFIYLFLFFLFFVEKKITHLDKRKKRRDHHELIDDNFIWTWLVEKIYIF